LKKRKVVVAVGTRPEAIKLSPVILALKRSSFFKSFVLVSNQQKETEKFLKIFDIKPDISFPNRDIHGDLLSSLSVLLKDFKDIYRRIKPDFILVQGDTLTALAGGIAAFLEKIPFGHVEAGLRTTNTFCPFPEEANRRIIDEIASICFVPTKEAEANLLKENIDKDRIKITGNTVIDAVRIIKDHFNDRDFLLKIEKNLKKLLGNFLFSNFFIFTCHRRENRNLKNLKIIADNIKSVLKKHSNFFCFLILHSNPAVSELLKKTFNKITNVKILPPLNYPEFIFLLERSSFVVTDSGGIQEESYFLGKTVFLIRDETERKELVKADNVIELGISKEIFFKKVDSFLKKEDYSLEKSNRFLLGDGYSAEKIVKFLKKFLK